MSNRATRGYGNGTLIGSIAKVVRRGYTALIGGVVRPDKIELTLNISKSVGVTLDLNKKIAIGLKR